MGSGKQARFLVLAVLASTAIFIGKPSAARAQAVMSIPGCTANVLPRNDDDYTDPIPLGFDFFFGNQFYSSLRINNNGFVSFGPQTPVWWMLRFWELFNTPLIALFHDDVDTRGPGSSPVTYGTFMFGLRPAICINWVNVGYFDSKDDKLNQFQLILVGRSDTGPGDVDVYMNYDQLAWDTPSASGAPIPPRAGIYDGSTVLHELPGSNMIGSLLDGGTSPLKQGTAGSPVLGRYMYQLRGGLPPETAVVTGTVVDSNGAPVSGAVVQACPTCLLGPGACVSGSTNSSGHYSLDGFAPTNIAGCAAWNVSVSPPAGSLTLPNTRPITFTATDQIIADADVVLDFPEFVPSGTTITPSVGGGFGSVPRVYWLTPLTLTTTGCASQLGLDPPIARYMITSDGGQDFTRCDTGSPATDPGLIRCGSMTEVFPPPILGIGTYRADVLPLSPAHGLVTVTMSLTCPDDPTDSIPPVTGTSSFSLYIDPSGWVQTTHGVPLEGAQVTLYRADSPAGPFEVVGDGSALMSPRNRNNPDFTDSAGHFAWDTVAGFYVVRAESPGCVSPTNLSQPFVETDVLPVPPEWLDLHLYLDCEGITPPELTVPAQVQAVASTTAGARVSYQVSAQDGRDGVVPVTCSSPSGGRFAVGMTMVQCSASDSSGNVAHGSFPVFVSYAWSNVLAPLHPQGPNRLQHGRTVPVEFALTGASARIENLVAHLYVARVIEGVPGPESPARSDDGPGSGSRFRFESCGHEYAFNWSTKGLAKGTYQLRIDLGDGVPHTVPVELR